MAILVGYDHEEKTGSSLYKEMIRDPGKQWCILIPDKNGQIIIYFDDIAQKHLKSKTGLALF